MGLEPTRPNCQVFAGFPARLPRGDEFLGDGFKGQHLGPARRVGPLHGERVDPIGEELALSPRPFPRLCQGEGRNAPEPHFVLATAAGISEYPRP